MTNETPPSPAEKRAALRQILIVTINQSFGRVVGPVGMTKRFLDLAIASRVGDTDPEYAQAMHEALVRLGKVLAPVDEKVKELAEACLKAQEVGKEVLDGLPPLLGGMIKDGIARGQREMEIKTAMAAKMAQASAKPGGVIVAS